MAKGAVPLVLACVVSEGGAGREAKGLVAVELQKAQAEEEKRNMEARG